jgi:hypothetical protein
MTDERSFRGLLHRATHRIPGVPAHTEQPAGHQARARRDCTPRRAVAPQPALNHRWNHSPARPPRVMVAWQRRIAAFFGQELR